MLNLIILSLWHSYVGIATNFSAHDKFNPIPYAACLHRDLRDSDLIIAHKTLPCGSKVLLYVPRTKRAVIACIGDRGPRKALVDLNVAVTNALRANGWETILMVPLTK